MNTLQYAGIALLFAAILAALIFASLERCDYCYDESNEDLPSQDRAFIGWIRSLKGNHHEPH